MPLSGNLGFVALDEVLRLLTRSDQQGSVDVRGEQVRGRIFITKGGIALATTSDDEGLHRLLVKSGLVEDDYLRSVESGDNTLSPLVEKSGGAIVALLREMTVESVYQLGLNGESFEVSEGATSRFASPHAFELEELLTDSKQRLTGWVEVSRVVDDLSAPVRFVRDLGDREEVKIDRESWMVLSEVGPGASVSQMAHQLGTTEFWTARVTARLIETDLVSVSEAETAVDEYVETAVEEYVDIPVEEPTEVTTDEHTEGSAEDTPAEEATSDWAFSEPVDEDAGRVNPNEPWWQEREDQTEGASDKTDERADQRLEAPVADADQPADDNAKIAAASEDQSRMPIEANGETADVERDTEEFLEKVSSKQQAAVEPQQEGQWLRRRRLIRDYDRT
jgi:hypothetical protein